MKRCILIALLLLGLKSFAQIPTDLPQLVLDEVNRVRDSVGAKPLEADATLDRAAQIQSDWCRKNDTLSHYQFKSKRLYEPFNRVFAVNGHHEGIAENLLYRFPEQGQSPQQLAQAIVAQWVHSPGHFKNMVAPVSRLSGLAFTIDPSKNRLYACQVFATSEWVIPPQLKVNKRAFRIKPRLEECCARLEKFSGREREFAYGYACAAPQGDEKYGKVYFKHDDYLLVKDMLNRPKGAVASDIVFRSQFPCCSANTLHGSPYHDGYLQRPRTWKWLAKHDIPDTLRPFQIKATTAKIPDLGTGEYQTNVVITKNKHFCRYSFPISILSGNLGPFSFQLAPDTVPFRNEGLWKRRQIEFRVPFARAKANVDPTYMRPILDSLKVPGTEVMGLRIRGFASIEGPIALNEDLYNDRANNILKIIQARQKAPIHMQASAAENWPEFRRDIFYSPYKWLLKLPVETVRDTLAKDKTLLGDIEYLLAQHRYADVVIDLRYPVAAREFTDAALIDSMTFALRYEWYYHAHRMQSEMIRRYLRNELEPEAILAIAIPTNTRTIPLIHNQQWLLERTRLGSVPVTKMQLDSSGTYPWFWVRKLLSTTQMMAYGFPNKTETPQKVWKNIQNLKSMRVPKSFTDVLELNYYIAAAKWNTARGLPDHKLLANIESRYAGDTIDIAEAVQLGLFYNSLMCTGESIRILSPFIQKHQLNEDLAFLYAWTAAARLDIVPEDQWLDAMMEAETLNPDRWHQMVDKDWQLLRWEQIKGRFCDCALSAASTH
jgi:hypothetical protein